MNLRIDYADFGTGKVCFGLKLGAGMQSLQMAAVAAAMLAAAGAMAFYEWTRIRALRPILNGHPAIVLYWISYLALFMLGITAALAAIIR